MAPNIGDLYMYPASHPHKVVDITSGRRHTLVIAVKQHPLPGDYWEQTEKYFESLCEDSRDSKLHMLFGQFLMALGRPDAEIDEKFANSYACTAQAVDYAKHFEQEGQQLLAQGNADAASGSLNMARLIRERIDKNQQNQ